MNLIKITYSFIKTCSINKRLIISLVEREIHSRYKGSIFGIFWVLLNPVFLLLIYTFVFSIVLKTRWDGQINSTRSFALILYAGLIVFNFFSECIAKSPSLITANVNLVKKVVFPLEILPIVTVGAALFHLTINLFAWFIFYFIFIGLPSVGSLLFPIIFLPLVFFTLGAIFFISSLGVYLRDINQIIGLLITMLLFLSPIFYPISAIPAEYQILLMLNPLTTGIEMSRDVLLMGIMPNVYPYMCYLIFSLLVFSLGLRWFEKTRIGFADVL